MVHAKVHAAEADEREIRQRAVISDGRFHVGHDALDVRPDAAGEQVGEFGGLRRQTGGVDDDARMRDLGEFRQFLIELELALLERGIVRPHRERVVEFAARRDAEHGQLRVHPRDVAVHADRIEHLDPFGDQLFAGDHHQAVVLADGNAHTVDALDHPFVLPDPHPHAWFEAFVAVIAPQDIAEHIARREAIGHAEGEQHPGQHIEIERIGELPLWEGDRQFLPLVFDHDPRPFHGVMPYLDGRMVGWRVSRV